MADQGNTRESHAATITFAPACGDPEVLDKIRELRPDCKSRSDAIRFSISIAKEAMGIKLFPDLKIDPPAKAQ